MNKTMLKRHLSIANLPTPIQKLEADVPNLEISVKRDDLTEFVGSGNKIRKLEYLLYDAKERGAETVCTCGGIQSNHCRATAFAARRLGMKPVLFLRGVEPEKGEGNLFLDNLLEAEIHWITPEQYKERDNLMNALKLTQAEPEKFYVIPEGGSNAIGSLGYLRCVEEMIQQTNLNDFDAIFCPVGSGGTYAGLLAGLDHFNITCDLIGINVTLTPAEDFKSHVREILKEYENEEFIPEKIPDEAIRIIDGYTGEAYAVPTENGLSWIKSLMLKTGLLLDPVYTAKAFDGMIQESKKEGYKKVLFLHSGGGFGTFAYSEKLI
ncbi:MAG TPA: D-cysteine desulfhydrase family protein [Thermotogota bacterium]|nr:D-cysteine desulfhydrase family protein [Thermotogota bacterium]